MGPFRLQWAAGLILFVVGQAVFATRVQHGIPWSLTEARSASGIDPANEGAVVLVHGTIESKERASDPEYLLPREQLVIQRWIEAPLKDSDDDVSWEHVSAAGSLRDAESRVHEATIAGLAFDLEHARLPPRLPRAEISEHDLRVDSRPPGAYATWSPSRGYFIAGPDVAPGGYELELSATGSEPAVKARATLGFRGVATKTEWSVVGRQSGGRLEPFVLADGASAVILSEESDPLRIAQKEQNEGLGAVGPVCGFLGSLGILLLFLHPLNVMAWVVTCGVGAIFMGFMHGFRQGLGNLFVGACAILASFVTLGIGSSTPSTGAVVLWIGCAALVALLVRIVKKPGDLDEELD